MYGSCDFPIFIWSNTLLMCLLRDLPFGMFPLVEYNVQQSDTIFQIGLNLPKRHKMIPLLYNFIIIFLYYCLSASSLFLLSLLFVLKHVHRFPFFKGREHIFLLIRKLVNIHVYIEVYICHSCFFSFLPFFFLPSFSLSFQFLLVSVSPFVSF